MKVQWSSAYHINIQKTKIINKKPNCGPEGVCLWHLGKSVPLNNYEGNWQTSSSTRMRGIVPKSQTKQINHLTAINSIIHCTCSIKILHTAVLLVASCSLSGPLTMGIIDLQICTIHDQHPKTVRVTPGCRSVKGCVTCDWKRYSV